MTEMKDAIERLAGILAELYPLDLYWEVEDSVRHAPASDAEITDAEARFGHAFPPSYKELLRLHRAWEHLWGGFTIVGTADPAVVGNALAEMKEDVEEQNAELEDDLGGLEPDVVRAWEADEDRFMHLDSHLVVALNFRGEYWVYDTTTRRDDGEMTLVTWDIGYGAQDPTWATIHELLEHQVSEAAARVKWIKENEGAS